MRKDAQKKPPGRPAKRSAYGGSKTDPDAAKAICKNATCKLRKASCYGFTACPGFKGE